MDEDESEFARRRLGEVLGGRWHLTRLLGAGGMGAVYAATGPGGREAAVKVLHPEMARRKDVRDRFVLEAQVAERIAHPGVVRLLEPPVGGDDATFLVMELLQGEPLGQRLRRAGTPTPAEATRWLEQILGVLAAAHAAGVIHRDLKPDNLFLTDQGAIKVLDFGVARVLEETPGRAKTRTGIAVGTLPYMSPEQALGKRDLVDARSDLFSLGATFFRLLSGRRIHEADSEAELLFAMARDPAPPLGRVAPHLPAGLCRIIDRALAFDRDARYPDAATMLAEVQQLEQGESLRGGHAVGGPASAATVADAEAPTRITREMTPSPVGPAPAAPAPGFGSPQEAEATQLSARARPLQHTVPLAAMPQRQFTTVKLDPPPPSQHTAPGPMPPSGPPSLGRAPPPSLAGMPPPPVSVEPPRIIRGTDGAGRELPSSRTGAQPASPSGPMATGAESVAPSTATSPVAPGPGHVAPTGGAGGRAGVLVGLALVAVLLVLGVAAAWWARRDAPAAEPAGGSSAPAGLATSPPTSGAARPAAPPRATAPQSPPTTRAAEPPAPGTAQDLPPGTSRLTGAPPAVTGGVPPPTGLPPAPATTAPPAHKGGGGKPNRGKGSDG